MFSSHSVSFSTFLGCCTTSLEHVLRPALILSCLLQLTDMHFCHSINTLDWPIQAISTRNPSNNRGQIYHHPEDKTLPRPLNNHQQYLPSTTLKVILWGAEYCILRALTGLRRKTRLTTPHNHPLTPQLLHLRNILPVVSQSYFSSFFDLISCVL